MPKLFERPKITGTVKNNVETVNHSMLEVFRMCSSGHIYIVEHTSTVSFSLIQVCLKIKKKQFSHHFTTTYSSMAKVLVC